jgi:peptidoglycan/LPS O-acetylase OafA/YrhL
MPKLNAEQSAVVSGRNSSLDALRGYAALFVVVAHTTIAGLFGVEPIWSEIKWSPLRIFWSGHQAVILFFVLSGFALTHMWRSVRSRRYDAYLISRVVRLVPPYIVSLILAFVAYRIASNFAVWDKGWLGVPKPDMSLDIFLDHLLMVGKFNTSEINPPIWSIVHEMRLSILFPIIYICVKTMRAYGLLCFTGVSLFVGWALSGNMTDLLGWQIDAAQTTHYATFFAAGTWLALYGDSLSESISRMSRSSRLLFWVLAAVLYAYPFDNSWSLGYRVYGDLLIGVGSLLAMLLIASSKFGLVVGVGKWLGNISYTLYLNHVVCLNMALIFFYREFGPIVVWIVTIPAAIIISTILSACIEVPSKRFANKIRHIICGSSPRVGTKIV